MAEMLRSSNFLVVTLYDEYGEEESRIADSVMIQDCGLKGRVLLTADLALITFWAREISQARIAVFVTTNNNEGPKQWGPRIIQAKRFILRELRRRQRPFTAKISTDGRVSQVRLFENGAWRTIQIPKKNPPHNSKYQKD